MEKWVVIYNMYLKSSELFNVTYSIDMLRLKTYISYSTFTEIEFRFETAYKQYLVDKYTSARIGNFFYNYKIEIEEGKSFWFGFLHNTEKREERNDMYNFTIEFNPNKLKDNFVLMYLLNLSGNWMIKSMDIACDVPVNILDIVYDKGRKRSCRIFSNGWDDRTIYLGKGDGKIRIYNKKIESGLNIKGDLTRVEIHKEYDDFPINNIKFFIVPEEIFPKVYTNKYIYSLKDYEDKTLFAIVYAVESGLDLSFLTRRYREKVKNLLQGGNEIKFSHKTVADLVRQVIYFYFINSKSKVIFR